MVVCAGAVEQSLTIRQAKTWLLSKHKKFISNRVVEFTVHPQRITINPYGRSGLLTTKQKPVQIDMDQVPCHNFTILLRYITVTILITVDVTMDHPRCRHNSLLLT